MKGKYRFKARTKEDGRWVHGGYTHDAQTDRHYIINSDGFKNNGAKLFEVIPETLCMGTGLYDVNSVEVYENDVLHGIALGTNGRELERYLKLVDLRDGTFYVLPDPYVGNNIRDFLSPTQADAKDKAKCSVVANIHDEDYKESKKGAIL